MRGLIGFFTGMILLICFTSCQKEIDWGLTNNPQSDSTTLSKIIALDTTLVPGQDTTAILRFTYDAQKRKNLEVFTEIDNSTGLRYMFSNYYKYNGTNTLPASFTEKYDFSTDSIIHYLSYSNGFVNKDSMVYYVGATQNYIYITYFSSLGGNLYSKKRIDYDWTSGGTLVLDSTTYTRTIVNGNMVSGRDSLWDPFTPLLMEIDGMQFSFDNKSNPLTNLTIWYLGYFDNLDDMINIDLGRNNVVTTRHDVLFPSPSTNTEVFLYSYNSSGYPVIIRSNGTDGNKAFYFYTRL